MRQKILIVEDSMSLAHTYEQYLADDDFDVEIAYTGQEAIEQLKSFSPDTVLLDLHLPDMNGMDILRQARKDENRAAFIVITGQASINTAVEAMRAGADDFVGKPVSPERLKVSIHNVLEKVQLKEIAHTYEFIKRSSFCDFVGQSHQMQAVYNIIENAAHSKASVFITGDSGTGKELCARAVHQMGGRREQSFEALNCAAIPHNLLESEIFGHMKGAFTGATSDREGAARRAHNGTLFLDELGEMPMVLQSKLLRFIQTGTFMPVGASKLQQVDVRFVCATNRDPLDAVRKGLLREDLYYRLNVIPIRMPSLGERGEDILLLAESFLERAAKEERKGFKSFSPEARVLLSQYPWPGNVRELENVVRSAVVLNTGEEILPQMLSLLSDPQTARDMMRSRSTEMSPPTDTRVATSPVQINSSYGIDTTGRFFDTPDQIQPLDILEREIIEEAISACGENITEASRRLGINPSTIHRKMKNWKNV